MSEVIMGRADAHTLLYHLALYGLGDILDAAGVPDVRVSWTPGMEPLPRVTGEGLTPERLDEAVRQHARARTEESSWVQRDVELKGTSRGLMSPRLTSFEDITVWSRVQEARHAELDLLTHGHAWADLRLLAALGEPCYWSQNGDGVPAQDRGTSRLEMQPRNNGSEFIKTRLRPLARFVGARNRGAVVTGINGSDLVDECGSDKDGSFTPTGLSMPSRTDNALAWCALWGIAALPIAARVNATARSSGYVGPALDGWFYAPVWEKPWRPSRLRTVLAARQLRDVAASGLSALWTADAEHELAARSWLAARGVVGVVRFPVGVFGSKSIPERRAMRGSTLSTEVLS
jgi:CRISPR-associated protein Csb3